MTLSKRPSTSPRRPAPPGGGLPAWLIFLLGIASVFGLYYIWLGISDFIATGGRGIAEATQQVVEQASATAEQIELERQQFTPRPSFTPLPECQNFVVNVPSAIVRGSPSSNGEILDSLDEGTAVCVLERVAENPDWYLIDRNTTTRRIERAYMFYNIIEAVNPTPTPSTTPSPAPSVTSAPTLTPSATFTPSSTPTPDLSATATPTPSPTTPPTVPIQSV